MTATASKRELEERRPENESKNGPTVQEALAKVSACLSHITAACATGVPCNTISDVYDGIESSLQPDIYDVSSNVFLDIYDRSTFGYLDLACGCAETVAFAGFSPEQVDEEVVPAEVAKARGEAPENSSKGCMG
jgi:hypothetical protein